MTVAVLVIVVIAQGFASTIPNFILVSYVYVTLF